MNRTLDSSGIHRIYEFVVSRPVDVGRAVVSRPVDVGPYTWSLARICFIITVVITP